MIFLGSLMKILQQAEKYRVGVSLNKVLGSWLLARSGQVVGARSGQVAGGRGSIWSGYRWLFARSGQVVHSNLTPLPQLQQLTSQGAVAGPPG